MAYDQAWHEALQSDFNLLPIRRREGIGAYWASVSSKKIEKKVRPFSDPLIQQARIADGAPVGSMHELYEAAAVGRGELKGLLESCQESFPGVQVGSGGRGGAAYSVNAVGRRP
jgi:hypothetical protein